MDFEIIGNEDGENNGCIEFYTIKEVSVIFKVHISTVERMIRDKRLSSTKPSHKRLIPKSEIHSLIAGNWVAADPPE